jgi:hypothetical protein
MNFIEIELGGKLRGLKFNNYAIEQFQRKMFKNENALVGGSNAATVYGIFFAGLTANCFTNDLEVDFTYNDVEDWVDSAADEDVKKICDCFAETNVYKKWLDKIKDAVKGESDKKKAVKKK